MRHNHKNHIGSRVQVCLWLPSKLEKPRKHIGHQNPKNRFIFAQKPKTRILIKRKTRNRNGQQNRNTEVFQCKNRKFHGPALCYRNTTWHNTIFAKHNTKFSSSVFGFAHVYSRSIKVLDYYDKTGVMIAEINCTNWRHYINVSYSAYWRRDRHFKWSSDECPCFRFPC